MRSPAASCVAVAAATILTSIGWPTLASADAVADAREAFEEGLALLDDERFADAVSAFERSIAHHETTAAVYDLGLACRGAGRIAAAVAAFERVIERLGDGSDDALLTNARTLREELRRQLARVTLDVRGDPSAVLLDGAPVASVSEPLILDPGLHVLETRRSGYLDQRAELRLAPGATERVTLDAAAAPVPARLEVHALPEAAVVRVDGAPRPGPDVRLELPAGPHMLSVTADGFEGVERTLELEPGGVERVSIALVPASSDLASEPWLWIAIAASAALIGGGIALGVYFGQPETPSYVGGTLGRVFFNLGP